MNPPPGDLVRSRVVDEPGEALRDALDRRLTGYIRFEPQDAVLLDEGTTGIVTVENGVPRLAYERETGRGGAEGLARFARPGPYRVALFSVVPERLREVHEEHGDRRSVPPALPAERLAGDTDLAERTRAVAPPALVDDTDVNSHGAVAAFLDDRERIEAIRERAREEASVRAVEWGLEGLLADDGRPGAADRPADPP